MKIEIGIRLNEEIEELRTRFDTRANKYEYMTNTSTNKPLLINI